MIYIYIFIYIYITHVIYSNQQKTNNIFKMKIFRLLPLLIHNISLYKYIYIIYIYNMLIYV